MDYYARPKNIDVMKGRPNHTETLLSTDNLSIGYRESANEIALLSNLRLQLHAGELVCFMGLNGIGKSSLIRTLAGIQNPLSGTISYTQPGELSTKVSVVLTDRIAATHLTVYELITFGRYPYLDWKAKLNKEDIQIIEQSIDEINIGHLTQKKLFQLSDGQLQMAMIARALAQDSSIIFLDEPTAHLDLNNRVEIMNLLRRLSHQSNKAILLATHELDLALQMADLIWLAGNNKNILTGIPEDLVLNGSFDEIFQFKGFDLKTGKVLQEQHRDIIVNIQGSGHEYLWTKNALERSGFTVHENASILIQIVNESSKLKWVLTKNGETVVMNSVEALLNALI
jgi:iron complex transport system ATP-binding protein